MTNDPRVEPLERAGKVYVVRDHFAAIVHVALLLGSARTLGWFNAWLVGALVLAVKASSALVLVRVNPAVLNARGTKRELDRREQLFFLVLALSSLTLPIVAGLEAGAPGWTHRSALALALGVGMTVAGGALTIWAMAVNAFFEPSVRLQDDRDQHVITAGPYRLVRHPGYLGASLVSTSIPLILGSVWALIPAAIQLAALVVRIGYEDRMLHEALPGYTEYAAQTRSRLVPGVW